MHIKNSNKNTEIENKKIAATIWGNGFKKTKQREQVLHILSNAKEPLNAMEIYAQMDKSAAPVWLSTVYRVLDAFTERGIAVKRTLPQQEMAVYELAGMAHKHYAICMACHKLIAMTDCPIHNFTPKLSDADFKVIDHKLEMYGYCGKCIAKGQEI